MAEPGDWEEKTVVDDSQLYSAKDGPNTASIGTITGDDELTIDEPNRSITGLRLKPQPQPAAAPAAPRPGGQVAETARGKLMVVAGNDSGREYPLLGKTITVGRGIDNDVVLTDIAVSRKHLSISFDGNRYHLNDKGSGNGTIINQRVETGTRPLSHGDRIEIGNTIFRFEHPASEKEAWPAGGPPAIPAPQPKTPSSGHAAPPLPNLRSTSGGHPPPPARPAPLPAPPLPPASPPNLPLAGQSPPEPPAALPPPQDIPQPPPETISGAIPLPTPGLSPGLAEPAFEVPRPELLPQTPSSAAPFLAPPPAPALAAPPHVPLVPLAPANPRKILVGLAAGLVGIIGIAVGGLFLGDDASMAQNAQPPVRIEEMVLPLIAPLLELGSPAPELGSPAPAVTPSVDPVAAPDGDAPAP